MHQDLLLFNALTNGTFLTSIVVSTHLFLYTLFQKKKVVKNVEFEQRIEVVHTFHGSHTRCSGDGARCIFFAENTLGTQKVKNKGQPIHSKTWMKMASTWLYLINFYLIILKCFFLRFFFKVKINKTLAGAHLIQKQKKKRKTSIKPKNWKVTRRWKNMHNARVQ